ALAVAVDEGRDFLVLRIEVQIVIFGDGAGIALGRGMGGDILDQLTSDIDTPAIAQRFQIFLPSSHRSAPFMDIVQLTLERRSVPVVFAAANEAFANLQHVNAAKRDCLIARSDRPELAFEGRSEEITHGGNAVLADRLMLWCPACVGKPAKETRKTGGDLVWPALRLAL